MMSTPFAKITTPKEKMLTLDEVRERLKDRNLMAVANSAGVHYNALYRLMKGGSNPSYKTVQKLIEYLQKS